MDPWVRIDKGNEEGLKQGDLVPKCYVPIYPEDYGDRAGEENVSVPVDVYDVIVITQSCDLVDDKIKLVAVLPFYSLSDFEKYNPAFAKNGKWENVRKGRVEGLHLIASPIDPKNWRASIVVDFREIYGLPLRYMKKRTGDLEPRWRLRSPFREEFSRAFDNYYSRVAVDKPFGKIN